MANMCAFPLTVQTGFQTNEIILLEGTSEEMCLNTVGEMSSDIPIDITLVESTDGEAFFRIRYCGNTPAYYRQVVHVSRTALTSSGARKS